MSGHVRWFTAAIFTLALILGHTGSVAAQPPKPVITTPTPQPVPTPEGGIDLAALGYTIFLPTVNGPEGDNTGGAEGLDVTPESFTYIVQPDDTLWSLALDFGRDLDTMSCTTHPLSLDAETLTPGQTVTVPALADLCYTVRPGDTLASIALNNGLTVEQIVAVTWNGFTAPPYYVVPKQRILLPGARRVAVARADRRVVSQPSDSWAASPWPEWPYGDGHFIWPVDGPISQGARPGHTAIDIAVPLGTQVVAADRGTVVRAGWNPSGYGFRVIIDHGNDYLTLYAHLSDIYVEKGQIVGKGQVIGVSGANGNITGPHLHFEIRDFGLLTDPLKLLPR